MGSDYIVAVALRGRKRPAVVAQHAASESAAVAAVGPAVVHNIPASSLEPVSLLTSLSAAKSCHVVSSTVVDLLSGL